MSGSERDSMSHEMARIVKKEMINSKKVCFLNIWSPNNNRCLGGRAFPYSNLSVDQNYEVEYFFFSSISFVP